MATEIAIRTFTDKTWANRRTASTLVDAERSRSTHATREHQDLNHRPDMTRHGSGALRIGPMGQNRNHAAINVGTGRKLWITTTRQIADMVGMSEASSPGICGSPPSERTPWRLSSISTGTSTDLDSLPKIDKQPVFDPRGGID